MKKEKLIKAVLASAVMLFACTFFTACEKSPSFIRDEAPDAAITFPSGDGVPITADIYMPYPQTAPLILLCHRAFWSRGEYREIAPALTEAGFNVIAVDLRSGDAINGVVNKTNTAALALDKETRFIDSLPDIQAAVDYIITKYAPNTFILWGSSYSASLGIITAKMNPKKIDAYIAFSPGEYFADADQGKPVDWIASEAAGVTIPVFFSADSTEEEPAMAIFSRITSKSKTSFFPKGKSAHGAEALFASSPASAETWEVLLQFLEPFARKR